MFDHLTQLACGVCRRQNLLRCLAVFALVSLLAPFATADDDPLTRRQEYFDNLKILGEVYERIMNNYVDEQDPRAIMQAGVEGMLSVLDEHSNYLPPVNYEDLVMSTEGEFGGLGITINIRDHFPTVVSPIEGTPAYYMGIQGGDQIIEIEGESAYDFTSREAVKLLRGTPGTKVNIKIARPGLEEPLPFTITRDIIKIESVPYAFMIGEIGYIRIGNFARTTADEVRAGLDKLGGEGMRGLILDLRFNPGGLLEAAQDVSELFLEKDELVVFTKGRLRSQNRSFYADPKGKIYQDVPIVVMINGSSASASEILSAALQDHDKGLIVGKTSFGKGSVQTVYRLDEDEALKLTTARYYTPSGRSIHKDRPRNGEADPEEAAEEPEVVEEERPDENLEGTPAEREVPRFDKEVYYTDAGRAVYGGGGITPDIEIEQEFLSDFEVAVERDGALFSYAVDYANRHEGLARDFEVSDEMRADFRTYLAERENIEEYLDVFGLTLSDSLLDANSAYLDRGIRREMSRRLWGPEAAYKVALEADVQLHEALDLFRKADTLPGLLKLAEQWNEEQMRQVAQEDVEPEGETVTN